MSNKTTFKRIALAVTAVLGIGLLNAAPSVSAVTNVSVTVTNGTATTLNSDSSTAATVVLSYLALTGGNTDSASVAVALREAVPSGASIGGAAVYWVDSSTPVSNNAPTFDTAASVSGVQSAAMSRYTRNAITTGVYRVLPAAAANNQISATFKVDLGETTTSTIVAGVYKFSVIVTTPAGVTTKDLDIVVSKVASESEVVDATKTTAVLSNISTVEATTLTADSSLAVSSTASASAKAYVRVRTYNASGVAAPETVTATITGAGAIKFGSVTGSSIKIAGDGDDVFEVLSDGRAGVGSIVIATTSKTFAAKTITFYAAAPATVTPSVRIPVVGTSAKTALRATAVDANGNVWGGQAYLFSQDTAVATAGSCSFNAALGVHDCSVTGVAAGQSSFKIGNASTEAASTVLTAAFNGPRVTTKTAATVKIEFDKAAYAPGEKATIYVTPLDDAGLGVVGGSLAGILATGGITSSVAFSSGSDTITATELQVAEISSSTTGAKAGSAMYTVYMPFGKGTVTLSATGGTSLPVAGRVAVTASADVVDDSVDAAVDAAQEATDAAIAATDAAILAQEAADEAASAAIAAQETAQAAVDAVTALSAEVTKLVAQLATLQKLLNRVAKRVGVKS